MKYEDGVYNISNEEYHASEGYSRSQLMLLDKSPYHFWYQYLSGLSTPKETTPAMIVGSLFHTLLLEPENFESEYIIKPTIKKLPEVGLLKDVGREIYSLQKESRERQVLINKAVMQRFEDSSRGKTVITEDQLDTTLKMADLVNKHEIVTTLLEEAQFEQSIFWTDKETELQFKTRPDIWSSKVVVDLKTTKDASPHRFTSSAYSYGYYLQAGMCYEAFQAIGKPFDMFVVLAVEKEEPYVPSVFMMDEEALQFGIDQFQSYKKKLKECIDNDKWTGYPVQELSIPRYAQINTDEE